MVLNQKETTVAYRCPECGATVMSLVGIFTLTADMIRLKCPCGQSELEIVYTKDKKVRLNVPCFLCPTPHSYLISSGMFFEKELFALPCSYSGVDVCFIGKKDRVQKALKQSEEELMELLGETSFEELAEHRGENGELTDPQVLDIILYVVRDLADEGKILCSCPDGGDYTVDIGDEEVSVRCRQCGDHLELPIASLTAATDFLGAESLDLRPKD
ncbi:MAG: hypothetical protein II889_08535 [Clostridia bacterium]|nr:hypothetical protein [Clostridia bacterium]MCR4906482.1 hypothetical protein [Clostridiales bacterium]